MNIIILFLALLWAVAANEEVAVLPELRGRELRIRTEGDEVNMARLCRRISRERYDLADRYYDNDNDFYYDLGLRDVSDLRDVEEACEDRYGEAKESEPQILLLY